MWISYPRKCYEQFISASFNNISKIFQKNVQFTPENVANLTDFGVRYFLYKIRLVLRTLMIRESHFASSFSTFNGLMVMFHAKHPTLPDAEAKVINSCLNRGREDPCSLGQESFQTCGCLMGGRFFQSRHALSSTLDLELAVKTCIFLKRRQLLALVALEATATRGFTDGGDTNELRLQNTL
ncbi:hypothetical protein L596_026783 [Steinernema carpocapsae]|uniref:Uncharacterized protein n=1 Tax=Steinernema carpocapsae TaxID=34508 RepID=A0A4U5M2D1_STECR|nr:hypothetical protein L596_026783 [Steinernema carpocapsae]